MSQAALVEPDIKVNIAIHACKGEFPNLVIVEDEQPGNALLKLDTLIAKDHPSII